MSREGENRFETLERKRTELQKFSDEAMKISLETKKKENEIE